MFRIEKLSICSINNDLCSGLRRWVILLDWALKVVMPGNCIQWFHYTVYVGVSALNVNGILLGQLHTVAHLLRKDTEALTEMQVIGA